MSQRIVNLSPAQAAAQAATATNNTTNNTTNTINTPSNSVIPQYSSNMLNNQNNNNQNQNQNQNGGSSTPIQVPLQQSTNANNTSTNSTSNSSSSQVVGLHYKIGKKIGEGSFGVIFEGSNMINGVPVAIKFEPRKTEAPQLRDEYRTYKHLNNLKGIPNAYYFGQEGLHNILVIDLLGPSLEDLFDWCGRKFSIKTTVQIAIQMIDLIKLVHDHDLIYRDIKPDNFLIGRHGLIDENDVHLVDFGMAKQYRDPRTKQHIPYREKKSLSGTARYMSVNTHLGREQSRRDDLEALGHVFFYFLKGQLPWQGLKAQTNKLKYEKIGEKKKSTNVYELCNGFPKQFAIYLETVRNLDFDETPNYESYKKLLLSILDDLNETYDGYYDWMDLNGGKGWDLNINKKPNLHGYGHPNPPGERERHRQQRKRQQQQQQQQQQLQQQQAQQQQQQAQLQQQQQQQAQQQVQLQQSAQQQQQQQGGGYPSPSQTNGDNRPLPNLPQSQQYNNQPQQQGQQDTSKYVNNQPYEINDPIRLNQQKNNTKGNSKNDDNKEDKGFLSKLFGCCS